MPSDPIVDDLQFFRGGHVQSGHVPDAARDPLHHWRLLVLEPARLADAVVGRDQLAGLRVVDYRAFELDGGIQVSCGVLRCFRIRKGAVNGLGLGIL